MFKKGDMPGKKEPACGVVYHESVVPWKPRESIFKKEGMINHQVNRDFHFSQDNKCPSRGVGSETKVGP